MNPTPPSMLSLSMYFTLFTLLVTPLVKAHVIRPFHVDVMHGVSRMRRLVQETHIPPALPPKTGPPSSTPGIDPRWLRTLQSTWTDQFDWETRQNYINSFDNYKTKLEGIDIHFIHARSTAPQNYEVIPIVLTHGWPGSFLEFLPVVDLLTRPTTLESGRNITFDVVIPSLPGFAFSAPPPPVWTVNDTARIWNTLMVDVLGYTSGYSVAGTDWGALVNWCLLNEYPLAKAAQFNFLGIVPPSMEAMTAAGAQLNRFERSGMESSALFFQTGTAYFIAHQTRPWTLGLALADNPMGQLAWIAEKHHDWSDPSLVDITQILTTVSLYYLTGTFPTSLYIYAQNTGFAPSDVRAVTNKPFGYGAFEWEGVRHPRAFVQGLGNLTYYKEHNRGGHFAPSEVPDLYADDIINMMGINYPKGSEIKADTETNFKVDLRHFQHILGPSL